MPCLYGGARSQFGHNQTANLLLQEYLEMFRQGPFFFKGDEEAGEKGSCVCAHICEV